MTKRRQSSRPRRIWRWEGVIKDMSPEAVGMETVPVDHEGYPLWMEFDRARVPHPQLGAVYTLYMHAKGKKTRLTIKPKDLGSWTEEELEQIKTQAHEYAVQLKDLADEPLSFPVELADSQATHYRDSYNSNDADASDTRSTG